MTPNVSPQEQAQYDAFMLAARGIIYGDPKQPQNVMPFKIILQRLVAGANDIGPTIGHMAAMIVSSIKGGIAQKGKQVPPDILFHAGQEIVAELVEIACGAGLVKKSQENAVRKQALFEGMRVYQQSQQQAKTPPQSAPQAPAQPIQPPQPQQPQQSGMIAGAMGA